MLKSVIFSPNPFFKANKFARSFESSDLSTAYDFRITTAGFVHLRRIARDNFTIINFVLIIATVRAPWPT